MHIDLTFCVSLCEHSYGLRGLRIDVLSCFYSVEDKEALLVPKQLVMH